MKKRNVKKIVIGLFVVLMLSLTAVISVELLKDKEAYWFVRCYEDISIGYYKPDKKAFCKNRTRISQFYDWVRIPNLISENPYVVFAKDNLRGYFDVKSEKVHIEAKFKHAWVFDRHYRLAAVQGVDTALIGFIGLNGEYQIPPRYPHNRSIYSQYHFVFDGKTSIVPLSNNTLELGLIDSSGHVLIRELDDISSLQYNHRVICSQGKKGLVNDEGKLVIPIEYEDLYCNSLGVVLVDGMYPRLLSYDYETVLTDFVFDEIESLYNSEWEYSSYNDAVEIGPYCSTRYAVFTINEKKGLYDLQNCKVLSEPIWDEISFMISDKHIVGTKDGVKILLEAQGGELKKRLSSS